jgi:excisionase family DNA binding protein
MADNPEKNKRKNKAREDMPQGSANKKLNKFWEWQRYVKKETQRLSKERVREASSETVKPPLPKGPERRVREKVDNGNLPQASVKKKRLTSEDLDRIEAQNEFDRDLVILMGDDSVKLDDSLKDWIEHETAPLPDVKTKSKVKKQPPKQIKAESQKALSRTETLELFGEELEKARRKRKNPRKTRENLIENLLDPIISLDEAAVILNVCKTTVRRYTNGDKLECLRTPGNQRRFKLSKVLEFLEEKDGRKTSQISDDTKD